MSQPPKEPLLPKIPLIALIGLVTTSAVVMAVVRQAVATQQMWAVLITVAVATVLSPALLYLATFALASLFSTVGSAAAGPERPSRVHVPTPRMPDDPA